MGNVYLMLFIPITTTNKKVAKFKKYISAEKWLIKIHNLFENQTRTMKPRF